MTRRLRRQRDAKGADLHLAPILNIVMILIPLILLSAVFTRAGVVEITSARRDIAPEDAPAERRGPQLVVHVSDGVWRLSDRATAMEVNIASLSELTEALVAFHTDATRREALDADSRLVRLGADPSVPFGTLVATMDAMREWTDPAGTRRDLFPDVALVTVP